VYWLCAKQKGTILQEAVPVLIAHRCARFFTHEGQSFRSGHPAACPRGADLTSMICYSTCRT
jgi:hypothetical protein